jgi:hypothetical protein
MSLKESQRSLRNWTTQDWGTKSGKPSSETGERYLPKKAIAALSSEEYAATTAAKKKDTAAGKQHSPQPKKIRKKTRQFRRIGKKEGGRFSIRFKENPLTKEELSYLSPSVNRIINDERYFLLKNFLDEEDIKNLKEEALLEKYSRQRKRNDPDAILGSDPEYSEINLTGNLIESIGRENKPKQIYTYLNPDVSKATLQHGEYDSSKDAITFPSTNKKVEAHEYLHRGFEKIFKDMPELENKLSLPKEEIEHIYIYSKVNPEEGLKKLKSLKYNGVSNREFNRLVKKGNEEVEKFIIPAYGRKLIDEE